jgi:DNA-binding HxlR family transcriptional regulator
MPRRTSYFDGCPTAHALDLIGNRWALLVVRELMVGPKRFSDLRRSLPRISSNVLVERLQELEEAEVLIHRTLPPPAGSAVYELTDRGRDLNTVLTAIGRWGASSPTLPRSDTLGVDTFVLALRSAFDPAADGDLDSTYELRVEEEAFTFAIHDGSLALRRGAGDDERSVLRVDPTAMAAVARGEVALADALAAIGETDESKVASFASLFVPPHVGDDAAHSD